MRHVHAADGLHALFAFFLLLEQLALTGNIAAVALRKHVLAQSPDVLASNNAGADSCLHGDFELLSGDEFLEALRHAQTVGVGLVLVDDRTESVNSVSVEENIDLDEVSDLFATLVVVQRGVAASARFEVVKEVEDDLREGKLVVQFDAIF